jgi:hypothetical protein
MDYGIVSFDNPCHQRHLDSNIKKMTIAVILKHASLLH